MADRRVLITTSYLEPGDEIHTMLTDAGCEVSYSRPQDRDGANGLAGALAEVDAVIAGTEPFSAELMDTAGALRIIARTGVGYDSVDLSAAARKGVTVCNTPGANRQSVAELAIGLMLSNARHLVPAAADVEAGNWVQRSGRELSGATLGVIGFGAIGKEVASIATAFGMRVLVCDPALDENFAHSIGAHARPLPELLAESDFVTLHIALTPQTHHLIDGDALAVMKPSAYLINTSRGGVVDERALAGALREERLAGAALDVLEQEPLAADDPLREAPNLVITPHIAGATAEARSRSGHLAATQVIDFLDGRPVAHPVAIPSTGGAEG